MNDTPWDAQRERGTRPRSRKADRPETGLTVGSPIDLAWSICQDRAASPRHQCTDFLLSRSATIDRPTDRTRSDLPLPTYHAAWPYRRLDIRTMARPSRREQSDGGMYEVRLTPAVPTSDVKYVGASPAKAEYDVEDPRDLPSTEAVECFRNDHLSKILPSQTSECLDSTRGIRVGHEATEFSY